MCSVRQLIVGNIGDKFDLLLSRNVTVIQLF